MDWGCVMSQGRDFVIELDGQPGSYRLHVSSPAGDDSVTVGLDPARLGVDLEALQARVVASAAKTRSMVPELERPLREVGRALFEAVFQPSPGRYFCPAATRQSGQGADCGSSCGCTRRSWRCCRGSCCSATT